MYGLLFVFRCKYKIMEKLITGKLEYWGEKQTQIENEGIFLKEWLPAA